MFGLNSGDEMLPNNPYIVKLDSTAYVQPGNTQENTLTFSYRNSFTHRHNSISDYFTAEKSVAWS